MSRIAVAAALGLVLLPQEPGPLQKSLADLEVQGTWKYNDLPLGLAEAKKSGKPLLVVFR